MSKGVKQLATSKFKDHFNSMSREEQQIITDSMSATAMRELVFGAQDPNNVGGKRRKTTRKQRKNRKMTRRRK